MGAPHIDVAEFIEGDINNRKTKGSAEHDDRVLVRAAPHARKQHKEALLSTSERRVWDRTAWAPSAFEEILTSITYQRQFVYSQHMGTMAVLVGTRRQGLWQVGKQGWTKRDGGRKHGRVERQWDTSGREEMRAASIISLASDLDHQEGIGGDVRLVPVPPRNANALCKERKSSPTAVAACNKHTPPEIKNKKPEIRNQTPETDRRCRRHLLRAFKRLPDLDTNAEAMFYYIR
ncbi:hypothetical protein B0H34DRAFT_810699 [Crassisporium funariophilum]|nr:hypothetical protein B0H34DRAFT_810699 [Crassisporium funariophilum]